MQEWLHKAQARVDADLLCRNDNQPSCVNKIMTFSHLDLWNLSLMVRVRKILIEWLF
jgi:hypothetical protein